MVKIYSIRALILLSLDLQNIFSREIIPGNRGNLMAVPKVRKFERNRQSHFEFVSLSSRVDEDYGSLPRKSAYFWDMNQPDFLFGDGCDVQLTLEVIDFEQVPLDASVTLCLFQENSSSIVSAFLPGSKLEILGNKFDPTLHFEKRQPITGFVMGEFNSLVQGFLVKRYFYGSIRIFDPLPHHHVVFYVEPISNLEFYVPKLLDYKKEAGINGFVFEYVRHEGESEQALMDDLPTFESKMDENVGSGAPDVFWRAKIKNGSSPSNLFDIRKDDFTVCEICVWVQPNFAKKFGHGGGIPMGVAALQRLLAFSQFIFEGIDFNNDNSPDNIQISVKSLQVTDKISLSAQTQTPNQAQGAVTVPTGPQGTAVAQGTTATQGTATGQGASQPTRRRRRATEDPASDEAEAETFTEETLNMNPKEAYDNLRPQLVKKFANHGCCAILGYVYHNLAPKLSYSTLGGICSNSHNVGIISGFVHAHKVAEFDIFRSTMHVLGHLFGAREDDIANPKCKVDAVQTPNIFNPTVMNSYQKIDLGMRPNSMRYSPCAKLDITAFLTTPNAHCLKGGSKEIARCGNGIVDPGEQCDCALPWQCHTDEMEKPSCCGESDSILGCRKVGGQRFQTDAHCHRPFVW